MSKKNVIRIHSIFADPLIRRKTLKTGAKQFNHRDIRRCHLPFWIFVVMRA